MVDIFFALINFGIIIGLIVYALIRFAIPLIQTKIEQEKQLERSLHDEHHQLVLDEKHVEESLVAQEAMCASLFNKIHQWKNVVVAQNVQQEAEQQHMLNEAEKKMLLQLQYYTQGQRYQQIMPLVTHLLEQDLKAHFIDERVGHAYMKQVLKKLQK